MPPAYDEPAARAWQRLDVRTVLTYPFAQGAPLVVLALIAAIVGGRLEVLLIRLGATVGFLLAFGAVHWWRFRYRLLDGRLETVSGLVSRRSKVINVDRIRGVEIEAKLAHRVAGVCALRIEHPGAASGSRGRNRDSRDRIDAVSLAEGERLRNALLHERTRAVAVDPRSTANDPAAPATAAERGTGDRVLLKMPARWLLYAPFSGRLLLVGPFGVLGLFSSVNEADVHLDRPVNAAAGNAGWAVWLVGAVLALVVTAVLAGAVGYWHWTVTARADDLVLTGGLLTRRVVAIERRRLRGVIVREPLTGRWVSAASLHVVLSGVTGSVRSAVIPLGPRPTVEHFAGTLVAPCTVPLCQHPSGALRRRRRRALAPGLLLVVAAGVVAVFDGTVALGLAATALVAVVGGVMWGYESYRTLGHAIDERVLTARHGVLIRHTETVERSSPIGLRVRQSIFARRAGVASVDVALVSRGFSRVADMAAGDVNSLAHLLLPELATDHPVAIGARVHRRHPDSDDVADPRGERRSPR